MNAKLDPTLLPALDAVQRALSKPRQYAPHPAADPTRVYEDEGRDAREFFEAEQCPSDASFR